MYASLRICGSLFYGNGRVLLQEEVGEGEERLDRSPVPKIKPIREGDTTVLSGNIVLWDKIRAVTKKDWRGGRQWPLNGLSWTRSVY